MACGRNLVDIGGQVMIPTISALSDISIGKCPRDRNPRIQSMLLDKLFQQLVLLGDEVGSPELAPLFHLLHSITFAFSESHFERQL
jgi:hypothetical protein